MAVPAPAVLALLLATLTLPGSVAATSASRERCARKLAHGFAASFASEARNAEACLQRPAGLSFEACLDADRSGLVSLARRLARAAEQRTCGAGPPPGATSAANASDAAGELERTLARGLFGREAPAPVRGRGGLCQQRLLRAANACAAARLAGFAACAEAARRAGADAESELRHCKLEELGATCGAPLERAAASCAEEDAGPLFPGCASDLARCARENARYAASRATNDAGGLCQQVLPGSLAERELLMCFEPPPPEPVIFSADELPPGVNAQTVEWEESGERLVIGFTAEGVGGTQLASLRPDGSEFRCLTCGSAIAGNLRPVQRLRDGRRALVAGPNNANPRWSVLECTPGLADCQTSRLVPIALPPNPDPSTPILQYRVPWVTPDDARFVWSEVRLRGPGGNLSAMGRLVREADRYVVADARVIAPPLRSLALGTDADLWQSFTQPYEAKFGALRGGRDQVEAGTPNAGHYDASVIDLATGEVRRLTRHPDHDEGIRFTRDEEWAVLQSARTDNRTEFLGLVPRPPYLEWTAFSIHFVGIAGAPGDGLSPGTDPNERDCYVDPWLIDRWFERGGYIGQRLLKPAAGWVSIEGNAGGFGFAPDGTRLALIERRWRHATPETRLRLAAFPNRLPIPPERVVAITPTPEPDWAIRYADWSVPDTRGVTVIPGKVSGTATVQNDKPNAVQGAIEVVYADYSDDGEHVLDGFERMSIPSLVLFGAEYEVDLVLGGAHTGSMRGAISYDFVGDVNSGEVVSELDGRVLTGPKSCFEAGLIPLP